uniref:Uncharacterized protein n=1 Tax=Onchocerca volvulus TaxID=6282 RepID=A0A8R1TWX4_ONCVO
MGISSRIKSETTKYLRRENKLEELVPESCENGNLRVLCEKHGVVAQFNFARQGTSFQYPEKFHHTTD